MNELTHIDEDGAARMVDVSDKDRTLRVAVAEGRVVLSADAAARVRAGDAPKGDVLGAARIAGIMAAKRTHDLVPLCHPLALTGVEVELDVLAEAVAVRATVRTQGPTGVEMEALTAVSVACLTVYDMAKAIDRTMRIEGIRLLRKSGGRSGDWSADDRPADDPGRSNAA